MRIHLAFNSLLQQQLFRLCICTTFGTGAVTNFFSHGLLHALSQALFFGNDNDGDFNDFTAFLGRLLNFGLVSIG